MTKKFVNVIGIKQAQNFLKKEKKEKLIDANNGIHKAGLFIEKEVKESIAGRKAEPASVDTGQFLRSPVTDNSKELVSIVSTNLQHAKWLEHGTSTIKPRRHFANTKARNRKKIIAFVQNEVK